MAIFSLAVSIRDIEIVGFGEMPDVLIVGLAYNGAFDGGALIHFLDGLGGGRTAGRAQAIHRVHDAQVRVGGSLMIDGADTTGIHTEAKFKLIGLGLRHVFGHRIDGTFGDGPFGAQHRARAVDHEHDRGRHFLLHFVLRKRTALLAVKSPVCLC